MKKTIDQHTDAADLCQRAKTRLAENRKCHKAGIEEGREGGIGVWDFTERRKAEEKLQKAELHYRLLHETILQGVVFQDVEGRIVSMNPAAVRILGRSPEEYLCHASESMKHPSLREDGLLLQESDHPSMEALRTGKGFTLHPIVLMFAISGSLMVSRIRFPKL